MLLTTHRAQLNLADDEVARLRDACDSRLEVTDGFVWLTVEGERGDIVLGAGDTYVVDSSDVVTVSALRGAASVRVRANVGAGRCRRTAVADRPSRLQQVMARFSLSSVALA